MEIQSHENKADIGFHLSNLCACPRRRHAPSFLPAFSGLILPGSFWQHLMGDFILRGEGIIPRMTSPPPSASPLVRIRPLSSFSFPLLLLWSSFCSPRRLGRNLLQPEGSSDSSPVVEPLISARLTGEQNWPFLLRLVSIKTHELHLLHFIRSHRKHDNSCVWVFFCRNKSFRVCRRRTSTNNLEKV